MKNYAKKMLDRDLKKIKAFQLIGFDVMLDHNCKAWLMEINANPSLNMYLERQNADGEQEKVLSEIDKYLKTLVLEDALKIVKTRKPLDDYG